MATIETNDISTHYVERGDGTPIVFIHGAILDHSQWAPQLDALADDYRVIAYDVRGHGRTGGSDRDRYSIDLLVDDLEALLDALDVENPILCGLSMGGCIAQVYAARHPDALSGLVLASTFSPEYLTLGDRLQRGFVLPATIPPMRLIGYERVERIIVWLNETFGSKGSSGNYEQVQALREGSPKMSTAEFAKTIRALGDFHDTQIDYSAITVPTLVLYGEHEPGFIHRHADRFGTVLPDATVHAVPDAGHASNMDNPEFYESALREFATRCLGGTVDSNADDNDGESKTDDNDGESKTDDNDGETRTDDNDGESAGPHL